MQNVSATDRILGRDSSGSGNVEEITPASLRTMLGVSSGANNYTHPTHPGDDFSVDTNVLSGASVVSDIDINVTTDTLGHVTDANGSVSTRTLTLSDLGFTGSSGANNYTHPTHITSNIDTSGATIVDSITTNNFGHITGMGTRTLTLSDLGFTGSSGANNYTHPSYSPGNVDTSGATIIDSITTNSTGHITVMGTRTLTLSDLGYTGSAGTTSVNLSGTSVQTVATIALSAQHCLDFTVHITHSSGIQACKILLMDNGSTAYCTEYAVMYSASLLGSFSCTTSGSNILLQFTPSNTGTTTVRYLLESVV